MTKARDEDRRLTLEVLDGNDNLLMVILTTWLRHATERDQPQGRKTDGQCGWIDLELLKGAAKLKSRKEWGCPRGQIAPGDSR